MVRRLTKLLSLCSIGVAVAFAVACEIRVRDSAFRTARDVHQLCLIADSSDESASAIEGRLNQWLESIDGDFNLEFVRVDADDPDTNWRALGIPSAPPTLPVTVLVGRDYGVGESFVIAHWEPSPTDDELASIVDSPIRHQLARELATKVAVLILAPADPGTDSPKIDNLRSVVDEGIAEERIGLSMITVDRHDPKEQLLCRFIGLRPDSPDTLCVAFGRGKLMTPPLIGDDINRENIDKLVDQIRQACSCSKPLPTMGVDIPLIWSDEIDGSVVLMDEELNLSELDAELQCMLAAKISNDDDSEGAIIPIPPGRQDEPPRVDRVSASNRSRAILIGLVLLCGVAIALAFLRPRSSQPDSI